MRAGIDREDPVASHASSERLGALRAHHWLKSLLLFVPPFAAAQRVTSPIRSPPSAQEDRCGVAGVVEASIAELSNEALAFFRALEVRRTVARDYSLEEIHMLRDFVREQLIVGGRKH